MKRTESYSSISTYKKCPRKYKFKYIDGIEDTPSEAMLRGKEIHNTVAFSKSLPSELKFVERFKRKKSRFICRNMQRASYINEEKELFIEFVEDKFGLDNEFENCDFDDSRAVFHGVIDYVKVIIDKKLLFEMSKEDNVNLYECAESIEIIDWKTGKSKSDKRQIESYCLYYFNLFPVDEIKCRLVYIDQKEDESWVVSREEVEDIKIWIQENKGIIEETKEYPCKPSGLCNMCSYNQLCIEERRKKEDNLLSFHSII